MFKIVDGLFESNGFCSKKTQNGYLYFYKEAANKDVFWLVIEEEEIEKLIHKQSELFNGCKEICLNPALDKNISMLILWNTGGNQNIKKMKDRIMLVEEDQYFFKKNVLYFSDTELQDLKQQIGDNSIADFMKEQLILPEIFAKYKENSTAQTWQALLYRIAIKLPFINIEIGKSEELESLFKRNNNELERKSLLDFSNTFFHLLKDCDTGKFNPEDWLKKLAPALEENNNGRQD